MKKQNAINIILASLVLFAVTFIVNIIYYPSSDFIISAMSACVTCLITEALALLSCWFIVLRGKKGIRAIWINYIVWTIFINFGNIIDILGI